MYDVNGLKDLDLLFSTQNFYQAQIFFKQKQFSELKLLT